jgi:O-antigen ligase/polysaccharide polymerase Wzy-like membrane protein
MSPRVANAPPEHAGGELRRRARSLLAAAPAGVLALLLLLAVWYDGAFDSRYWTPLAILALVMLVSALLGGGVRLDRGPFAVAVIAVWAFAAWTLLSALWAESPARAWEGGARTILYAALVTIVVTLPGRRQALKLGLAIIAGIGIIAAATLIGLHIEGEDFFLAGRLDDPIGYRNATATLFAFGFWPLIGLAVERYRAPPLRAVALAAAVLSLGLAFLTQSRGVMIGLCAGAVVFLAIGPDRLRRAWAALAAAGGVAIASGPLLAPYHAFQDGEPVTGSVVDEATTALTLLTLTALAVGFFTALLDNGLRASRIGDAARGAAAIGLGMVAVLAAVAALVAIGNPVTYTEDKWDEFTRTDSATTGSTRLGSVGGQRYDLWRVALSEFDSQPLAGVGESNYAFDYYEERRTDRNLSDPHSLPFRLLSETGIVGTLVFVGFLVALGIAIARSARSTLPSEQRIVAGLAAAGTVVIGQAMTDWLWLIPAVVGLGLLSLALAAIPRGRAEDRPPPLPLGPHGHRWRRLGRYASAALLAAAAVSIGFLFLSDLYVREARTELDDGSTAAQLSAARRAEDLNPVSVTPLYLQASALESEGEGDAARKVLLEALAQEPKNFVTLALLGDLQVRAGELGDAADYYQKASELNPLDIGLQQLAKTTPQTQSKSG